MSTKQTASSSQMHKESSKYSLTQGYQISEVIYSQNSQINENQNYTFSFTVTDDVEENCLVNNFIQQYDCNKFSMQNLKEFHFFN